MRRIVESDGDRWDDEATDRITAILGEAVYRYLRERGLLGMTGGREAEGPRSPRKQRETPEFGPEIPLTRT